MGGIWSNWAGLKFNLFGLQGTIFQKLTACTSYLDINCQKKKMSKNGPHTNSALKIT